MTFTHPTLADYAPCIDCPRVGGQSTAGPTACCRERYVQVAAAAFAFPSKGAAAAPVNRAQRRAQQKMGVKPRRLR